MPVNAPSLVFRPNYNAKTRAIAKSNVGDGTSSGETQYRMIVLHPGTEPRLFSVYNGDMLRENVPKQIIAMIRRKT